MDSKEVIRDLSLCLNIINKDLISDDNITSEIAYIQVKCAIILTKEWLVKADDICELRTLDEVNFYVFMMGSSLLIHNDIKIIEKVLYGSDSLPLDEEGFIWQQLAHMISILAVIVKNEKSCVKLLNFVNYAKDKYNQIYNEILARNKGQDRK